MVCKLLGSQAYRVRGLLQLISHADCRCTPEHQIVSDFKDNSVIMFLISERNITYDLSLEPSRPDGSTEGSHYMF